MLRITPHVIDEERIDQLCDQIEDGQICDDISVESGAAIYEIERLIGAPVRQYTDPLRRLLKKKRIPDFSQHKCDIYGQTYRIRGIASMCNQGEAERCAREKKFKVEIPEPMWWPEKGDLILSATIYVDERYLKMIQCIVKSDDIDKIQISSKSLSKRDARMRRLGQWMHLYRNSFKYYIEKLWEKGGDLASIDTVNYRQIER